MIYQQWLATALQPSQTAGAESSCSNSKPLQIVGGKAWRTCPSLARTLVPSALATVTSKRARASSTSARLQWQWQGRLMPCQQLHVSIAFPGQQPTCGSKNNPAAHAHSVAVQAPASGQLHPGTHLRSQAPSRACTSRTTKSMRWPAAPSPAASTMSATSTSAGVSCAPLTAGRQAQRAMTGVQAVRIGTVACRHAHAANQPTPHLQ